MAGVLVQGWMSAPFLMSLSMIMTKDDGLFEAAKCSQILSRASSGSSRLSKASASLHAEGASSLYFLEAFSTLGFGVRQPRKTPCSIHRMLTMRRSAGFLAPFRISYKEAMSSS